MRVFACCWVLLLLLLQLLLVVLLAFTTLRGFGQGCFSEYLSSGSPRAMGCCVFHSRHTEPSKVPSWVSVHRPNLPFLKAPEPFASDLNRCPRDSTLRECGFRSLPKGTARSTLRKIPSPRSRPTAKKAKEKESRTKRRRILCPRARERTAKAKERLAMMSQCPKARERARVATTGARQPPRLGQTI